MSDRKVYITLKGKIKAKTDAKAADISISVIDKDGEVGIEVLDQECSNPKLSKGTISCDAKIDILMLIEDADPSRIRAGDSVEAAMEALRFLAEDSSPKAKRVHGWALLQDFKFRLTGWEITDCCPCCHCRPCCPC
jgi:hypothetical protein